MVTVSPDQRTAHADVSQLGVPAPANAPGVQVNRWQLPAAATSAAFSRAASHAGFALADGSLRLVPLRRYGCRKMTTSWIHDGPARRLRPDCTDHGLLSWGEDGRVQAVGADGFAAELADAGGEPITAVASASHRRGWRAVAHDDRVALFDRHGRAFAALRPATGGITDIAFDGPGGRLIAAHSGGLTAWTLSAGDLASASPIRIDWPGRLTHLAWGPKGDKVAAIDTPGMVAGWQVGDRALGLRFACFGLISALAWSPDGRYLVGAGGDGILSWEDTALGDLDCLPARLGVVSGCRVTAFACHPRCAMAAAAYDDGSMILLDLAQGRELMIQHADGSLIETLVWSPDGEFLATGSKGGTAALFDFTALSRRQS